MSEKHETAEVDWTSTPPTEPGWYWARNPDGVVYAQQLRARSLPGLWAPAAEGWTMRSVATAEGLSRHGWLWHPVPLTPPPVRKEPSDV